MEHHIAVLIRSSSSAVHACAAPILHASTGGTYYKLCAEKAPVEHQGKAQPAITAQALENLYYSAMSSKRGAIFDVPVEHIQPMISFLRDTLATLTELKTAIVCTSPDDASQKIARETLDELCAAGMAPSRVQILFTDAPNTEFEAHYSTVTGFAREAEIVVSPAATLTESPMFAKAQQLQLPIAAVLNRLIDFDVELAAARRDDAPEKVRLALAARAIIQRSLLAAADSGTFDRVVHALGLPRISREEWRNESTATLTRKRALQPTS